MNGRYLTHGAYLINALRVGESHPFIAACRLAGVEPSAREVARWRRGAGKALDAAWRRWPRSKTLPQLNREREERARG